MLPTTTYTITKEIPIKTGHVPSNNWTTPNNNWTTFLDHLMIPPFMQAVHSAWDPCFPSESLVGGLQPLCFHPLAGATQQGSRNRGSVVK